MNREQFLLTKLAEECNEVAQMALKCQQFGLEESKNGEFVTNRELLHAELNDIYASVEMLNSYGLDFKPDPEAIKKKKIK